MARVASHITHESARKMGGIGAVLNGLCSTHTYKNHFDKTLFYGPYFEFGAEFAADFGKEGQVLFSSKHNFDRGDWGTVFGDIIRDYGVDIIYGKRTVTSDFDANKQNAVDVVNVSINKINVHAVTRFKYKLWQNFAIRSDQFEGDWDYEQYLRIAIPYVEIVDKLYGSSNEFTHFSHEYMGMASCLAVVLAERTDKTVFVAHEVSPARAVVENTAGVDITFYNLMKQAGGKESLEDVFGSQQKNARCELVKKATLLDRIYAVSDLVKAEYQFLLPEAQAEKVRVVYNGVSARPVTAGHKAASRARIDAYVDNLLNYTPDVVFTHITRLVPSKGLWRDIAMLSYMDSLFDAANLKGAYILVSTLIATGRPAADTARMEKEYGWPVLHRKGWPDLTGSEEEIYEQVELFNSRSRAIKCVFINQFGFDRTTCGLRVPADMDLSDLRIGSDAELGFSTYEPFGIAQVETVPFGGMAVLSSACGCAYLLEKAFEVCPVKPFKIVDFISAGAAMGGGELKAITKEQRDVLERQLLSRAAGEIFGMLPLTAKMRSQYLSAAQEFGPLISWENVVRDYFLVNLP